MAITMIALPSSAFRITRSVSFSSIGARRLLSESIGSTSTSTGSIDLATKDNAYMKLAIRQAQRSFREKEVPIGAVIVDSLGNVVATASNELEKLKDVSGHAEILAIRRASMIKNNWKLDDCTLYTTLEPCPMCINAIQSARIGRVVFAAHDSKLGACGSYVDLVNSIPHPFYKVSVSLGPHGEESKNLLKRYFVIKRKEAYITGNIDRAKGYDIEEK